MGHITNRSLSNDTGFFNKPGHASKGSNRYQQNSSDQEDNLVNCGSEFTPYVSKQKPQISEQDKMRTLIEKKLKERQEANRESTESWELTQIKSFGDRLETIMNDTQRSVNRGDRNANLNLKK